MAGNFSLRTDARHCLITQSGKDKSTLEADDLMLCDFDGVAVDAGLKPSAETALHTALYRHDASIGAVLHTHSIMSTVLSRQLAADLSLSGFEMQKALRGVRSHEDPVTIALFENTQDMHALATAVVGRLAAGTLTVPGFLVRGHGLYAWGADLAEAQRHVEGFEFLLACAWQERQAAS
jgi:methylthioribulose-1-phosphate dehydratase